MARIRTVKPELSAHEGMYDLEVETKLPMRFAWVMLFTVADREGRFVWRPRTLKAQILPHDPVDFSRVLDAWLTRGYIRKYRVGNEWFGWIPTFTKHQVINHRESASDLPPIDEAEAEESPTYQVDTDACGTREPPVIDACPTRAGRADAEGKEGREGKEGKGTTRRDASATFDPTTIEGLDIGAWTRWERYRTEVRKPIKPPSRQSAAEEMAKLGPLQAAAVQHSIAQGYQGLVSPPKPQQGISSTVPFRPKTAEELEAMEAARATG